MDNDEFTNYWHTLCSNTGFIDTRATARSRAGDHCGSISYCICPNGRTIRGNNSTPTYERKTARNEP